MVHANLGRPTQGVQIYTQRSRTSHVVYARNRKQADRRMKAFLSEQMFGTFALWDYPADVETLCRIYTPQCDEEPNLRSKTMTCFTIFLWGLWGVLGAGLGVFVLIMLLETWRLLRPGKHQTVGEYNSKVLTMEYRNELALQIVGEPTTRITWGADSPSCLEVYQVLKARSLELQSSGDKRQYTDFD